MSGQHYSYSAVEEIWHAVLHGLGAIAALIALIFLVVKSAGHPSGFGPLSTGLFGAGMVIMFTTSTLYHCAYQSPFQPFLKMLDHSAIYIMIATGYMPFALMVLPLETGYPIAIAVGIVAFLGVLFKLIMFLLKRQHQLRWVSLAVYLLMGWGAVLLAKPLYTSLKAEGFYWLAVGGLAYTLGAGFYARKSMTYSHAIWHFCVLLGAACHFVTVYFYII